MAEQRVGIACGAITLEGRLHLPEGSPAPAGIVVCHPHPLYGGDMSNPVVASICRVAGATGLATLRFNFRGTGASGGSHGDGRLEPEDVRSAITYLAKQAALPPGSIGLAGYSFGALMALAAGLADDRVAALAAVSPPLATRPVEGLDALSKPLLLISGTHDSFVPVESLHALAAQHPGRVTLHLVEGEDHFWWSNVGEAARVVGEFFTQHLPLAR